MLNNDTTTQITRHPVTYELRTSTGWVPMTGHVLLGGGYSTINDVPAILKTAHSLLSTDDVMVTSVGKGEPFTG